VRKTGFSLIEILIVFAVIALIVGIAIPNYLHARRTTHQNVCISHLRHIDDAKAMWAIFEGAESTDTPGWKDLVPTYLREVPVCPADGKYTMGTVDDNPTCTIPGHELPGGGGTSPGTSSSVEELKPSEDGDSSTP